MSEPEVSQPLEGNEEVDVAKGVEEEANLNNNQSPFQELGVFHEGAELPPEVLRRLKALKKIQVEFTQTEAAFFKEMHEMEAKYAPMYAKYFEKRTEIISGKYEPTDAECDFSLGEADLIDAVSNLSMENKPKEDKQPVPGIPEFWLTIFKNVEMLSDMVHEQDLLILKHLADITVEMIAKPMGFKLLFHFTDNEYFTNQVLTKTYEMKCEVDSQDPFSFEGPEIIKCTGCTVDWKEGKNVTVRVVRKKQKHKNSGTIRTVSKTESMPSFFDFFNPPQVVDEAETDEETQMRLTSDFEVGQYIRERIVPRAVLYYTGEALDDEYDDDDDEEEEDETETDLEDDDSPVRGRARTRDQDQDADDTRGERGAKGAKKEPPPECKQQ